MSRVVATIRDALGRPKATKFKTNATDTTGFLDVAGLFDVGDLVRQSTYSKSGQATRAQSFYYLNDATGLTAQAGDYDTGIDTISPDEVGNPKEILNSYGGNRISRTFDAMNRPTQEKILHPTSGALLATVNFAYDNNPDGSLPKPLGSLTQVTGTYGTVQFFYDA